MQDLNETMKDANILFSENIRIFKEALKLVQKDQDKESKDLE